MLFFNMYVSFFLTMMKLTEALKLTAPLTMDTCTEEGAAFNAFVKVVHITELHANISAKHTPLATKNEDFFFFTYISRVRIFTRGHNNNKIYTFSGTRFSCLAMELRNNSVRSSEKSFANTEDKAAKKPEMIAKGIKEGAM